MHFQENSVKSQKVSAIPVCCLEWDSQDPPLFQGLQPSRPLESNCFSLVELSSSQLVNRYLADTDIADTYPADTDTDMPIPISSLPITIYWYGYQQKYWLLEYISIRWTHIGQTLCVEWQSHTWVSKVRQLCVLKPHCALFCVVFGWLLRRCRFRRQNGEF